jgi:ferritin
MITKKIEDALNKQMNEELHAGYTYLSMSAYFNSINLEGYAHWMRIQAREELGHSMKLFDFMIEREGSVTLTPVKAPPKTWKTPLAACEDALKTERVNTKQINDLTELAIAAKDHATRVFLQWFVAEQVEEESSASRLVEKVKMVKDDKGAMFILDQELSKRQPGAS